MHKFHTYLLITDSMQNVLLITFLCFSKTFDTNLEQLFPTIAKVSYRKNAAICQNFIINILILNKLQQT